MAYKISRRELAKAALVGAAVVALPSVAGSQETPKPTPEPTDEVTAVEKKLGKPLSDKAKTLLKNSLNDVRTASEARLTTKLPENSEPCFTFFATPAGGKK